MLPGVAWFALFAHTSKPAGGAASPDGLPLAWSAREPLIPVRPHAKTACSRILVRKSWVSGPRERGGDAESCLAARGPNEGANGVVKPLPALASMGGTTGWFAHGAANRPFGCVG